MKIPVFPLNGAILFPKTNLPLNIFEDRYIKMVDYCLSDNRLIGMIQKKQNNELYKIGCYGRINAFNETPDKRYVINLEGISTYRIIKEIKTSYDFRICEIDIITDYNNNSLNEVQKSKVLECFRKYNDVKKLNLSIDPLLELNPVIDVILTDTFGWLSITLQE